MTVALQILFALFIIILLILFVFRPKRKPLFELPANYPDLLADYVPFYAALDEDSKKRFEDRFARFHAAVRITGANAEVEDLDRVLIGAAAIIPVFYIPDWDYVNLREVLLYPGRFNLDFEQGGPDRTVSGMVGNQHLEGVLLLSKWEMRQGFINPHSNRNVAVHEFVHLVDKMDGTLDGVPQILLERKYMDRWKALLEATANSIRNGESDIDAYGATSPVECFAVVSEYYFNQPELFKERHPELAEGLGRIYRSR
ncbi:MAG: zinc-dependent peptidase [Flaviaesturariibacter sp.]|nr:zinc-dependent peptidase [Flaviaesturariibacter sp.]